MITVPVDTTNSAVEHEREFYVKPSKVQKGDVIVKPEDLPDAMLADLAVTHPREFGEAARARGLQPLEEEEEDAPGAGDDDEDDDAEEVWTTTQVKFLTSSAAEAVAMVEAAAQAQDVDAIAAFAIAEDSKEKPRKSVLEALAKAVGE